MLVRVRLLTRFLGGGRPAIRSARPEFKSSARFNYRGQVKDPKLEQLIVKTVAGLMNAEGGTLLIGVDDHGQVLGLQPDYQTLGKPNRDGYELFLTELLKTNLSGTALTLTRISFSEVDGKDVCRIDAAASAQPVFTRPPGGKQFSEFWARIRQQHQATDRYRHGPVPTRPLELSRMRPRPNFGHFRSSVRVLDGGLERAPLAGRRAHLRVRTRLPRISRSGP